MTTYREKIAIDRVVGWELEQKTIAELQRLVSPSIQKIEDKFHKFDAYDSVTNTYYEIKNRTVASSRYYTTMLPDLKLQYADANPSARYVFVFQFTDGIFSIDYDKVLFSTYMQKIAGRKDRFRNEDQMYRYIPIAHMKQIDIPEVVCWLRK